MSPLNVKLPSFPVSCKPPTPRYLADDLVYLFHLDDPPFTRLITPSDRYYDASSVHIEGIFPPYVPNSAGYAHPSPPVTPTVPQSAHTTTAGPSEEDEEQDTGHEELPLIKLPFGVWKCGVCDKQLRRKHRAIVHFLNKHGDMRLRCQGRCGLKAW
jgi:hypothetical protein